MELPNIHFKDEPIVFKKISQHDFDDNFYEVEEIKQIEPNEEGYIGENLKPVLNEDFLNSNTTIINAGVGQGKSRTIIELINDFYATDDFVVIIAVPFNSLIEQYYKDCSKYIDKNEIYTSTPVESDNIENFVFGIINDEDFIENNEKEEKVKKLNIITVNTLLANPGDELLFPSYKKEKYFENLRNHCVGSNKKIVLFFDEVHATIKNFKPENIYHLWHYHGLIHKNFVISATFNEASKEVIKYLSEFTQKKIFIIESTRTRNKREPSNLHLQYYSDSSIHKDPKLVNLLSFLIDKESSFDMLVYSKDLINKFLKRTRTESSSKNEVCDLLYPIQFIINKCYSDPFNKSANRKYNPKLINIGTNFSTGVNIEDKNHNFVIILPKTLNIDFVNNKGVFSDGPISIIQSLARQRKKGNIYIFLEYPLNLEVDSLPYTNEKNGILVDFISKNLTSDNESILFTDYNKQSLELKSTYRALVNKVKSIKPKISSLDRSGMNYLKYPSREEFILSKGEKHLNNNFFSGHLSTYVTWAALTNQFLNCTLKSINMNHVISFNSDYLIAEFMEYVIHNTLGVIGFSGNADLGFYNKFKLEFSETSNREILIDRNEIDTNKRKELHLIYLCYALGTEISDSKEVSREEKNEVQWKYLKSCVFYANKFEKSKHKPIEFTDILEGTEFEIDPKKANVKLNEELIECYKKWMFLIDIIEQERKNCENKLPNKAFKGFIKYYRENKFNENLKKLFNLDSVFKESILPLKTNFKTKKGFDSQVNFIYNLIIKNFYGLKSTTTTIEKKTTRYYLFSDNIDWGKTVNLLY